MFYNLFMDMDKDTRGIFITATGTDVGKTYISSLLLKLLHQSGVNCGYYKPAMSGVCSEYPSDVQIVQNVANLLSEKCSVSYSFEEAVSPHLAASRQGVNISLDKIIADYSKCSEKVDYLVVEGAGGITCPFNLGNQQLLLSDVIKALNLGILIVSDAGLGTLNSTILTCEYAKSQGLKIKGVILNNFDADNFIHQDNLVQVKKLSGVEVIATVSKGATELGIDSEILKGIFN